MPAPIPESRPLRLWVVLSRAFAAVDAHARADFARHGFSPGEFGALEVLHHRGALTLGELQRKILVSSGGITWVIDRLESKGLVARHPSPEDRRAVKVDLTEAGAERIAAIFPAHQAVIEAAMAGLEADEVEALMDLLRKMGREAASLSIAAPEMEAPGTPAAST